MQKGNKTKKELLLEIEDLRVQLEEAEETLRAIRSGEVDALVISGPKGDQIFTLKGAEQPYRILVEAMNEGAVTLIPDGTILYCNTHLGEMIKTPLEQVTGSSFYRFVVPEDQQMFEALLEQARKGSGRTEITLRAADGTLVPVHVSAKTLETDDLQGISIVVTDLTEIIAVEKLTRSILDQAVEAIVVCDESGQIIRATQAAYRLCGKNLIAQPFDAVFRLRLGSEEVPRPSLQMGDNENKKKLFSISAALCGEILQGIEVSFERNDGKVFNLLLSTGPLLGTQNEIVGCVVTLINITERKRMEQELIRSERLATIGEIATGIAHEIRNPLSGISVALEGMKNETQNPDHKQTISDILKEIARLERIIKDLLKLAQLSYPQSLNLIECDPNEIVERALSLVSLKAKEKGIGIEKRLKCTEHFKVDQEQIQQVIINLLINGIEAIDGSGKLTVETESSNGYVEIRVSDTGCGFSEEDKEKIFQPFYSNKEHGTGLGLSISHRIVEIHKGKIIASSEKGKGSTFTVMIPTNLMNE